jgi:DNA segregation ATPase FtsK/SpoIIIE-like protein
MDDIGTMDPEKNSAETQKMKVEEKRTFARYAVESECEVRIDSETLKGKVVDYSDGIGVIIKKNPKLAKGAEAELRIVGSEIEFSAEIAWTTDLGYHLRVGFRRVGNLRGNLEYYRLPDVLIGINKRGKTGILEITTGSIVRKIYIRNGDKIFAASTDEDDRLGEMLIKEGEITLEEFNQASYLVSKTGERLGKVLVNLGYLKQNDLVRVVQNQVERIILALFNVGEGKFEFREGSLPSAEPITLQISSANLVYKGIKQINNFVLVKKMCPPEDTIFNVSQNPMKIFKSITLEDSDKQILSYVNGVNPLKKILSLSSSKNFDTLKTIITLHSIGLIHIKGEHEVPSRLPIEVIFGESGEAAEEYPEELVSEEQVITKEVTGMEYLLETKEYTESTEVAESSAAVESDKDHELKAEEEARLKAEEEARQKAEEEARLKAEEEARQKAEEEARQKAEEEARQKAEEEARLKAEEEARLKAEEEARLKAEEEARLKAEEEARLKAEEEARLKAEEEARQKTEEEARLKAEEEARQKAEEEAASVTAPGADETVMEPEKIPSRRKWIYVSALVVLMAAAAAYFFLLREDFGKLQLPVPAETVRKAAPVAPEESKKSVQAPAKIPERSTPYPSFREDAFRKFLKE